MDSVLKMSLSIEYHTKSDPPLALEATEPLAEPVAEPVAELAVELINNHLISVHQKR